MFENIRIVMVNTTHPGNIGAAARAMKNMGLSRLTLVQPEKFPDLQATVRASGADDILANAVICEDLPTAIADCALVCGTSARTRALPWPLCDPRQAAATLLEQPKEAELAMVFGREHSGLTNDELAQCHFHVNIPTNESFSSLNLAAAIQVICYELRMASTGEIKHKQRDSRLANMEEVNGLHEHFQSTLTELGFLDPNQPKQLLQRLRRLFNRAQLEKNELNILRGILSQVDKHLK